MGRRKKHGSKKKTYREDLDETIQPSSQVQKIDLDRPYNIETSATIGRYLTAKKDLKAGEIIMRDEAIVIGPCQESKPLCIGCFIDINLDDEKSYKRCSKCSWPLCSPVCPGSHLTPPSGRGSYVCHTSDECDFLSASLINRADPSTLKTCFYAITPLRLLMIKQIKPELWEVVEQMEPHTEARKKNEKLWKMNEELAVNKIQKTFGLSFLKEEEIHFSCGVLEVNAFEVIISPNHQPLRAIYPNAYLFSHDCVPNTCHSTGENFSLIVKTLSSIPKNSPITVTYTYTLQSTVNRRKHLQDTKFFSCCCQRCSDVTEFGLYCNAVKCHVCKTGLVLPKNPLDDNSDWSCEGRKCSANKIPAAAITVMSQKISDELDSINGNDLQGYENFLQKYKNTLHENHYLCLSAMHSLFQLYGKINGYIIDKLTEDQLERKIQICKKLLRIFEKLEPGLSKQKGILLYELHAPLMIKLRRRFEQQTIEKKEIRQRLREINRCLEESSLILATEWKGSAEGQIAIAAKAALENMKNWESIVDML